MNEAKKDVRNRWLHIRLNEAEYNAISRHRETTTSKELSDYARRILLKKPVTVNHRDQSADDVLAEMIRIKNALTTLGNEFLLAERRLHALHTVSQVKAWLATHETWKASLLKTTEEIKQRMIQIHEEWSRKSQRQTP